MKIHLTAFSYLQHLITSDIESTSQYEDKDKYKTWIKKLKK